MRGGQRGREIPDGYGSEEDLIQNLRDAGCGQEQIRQFLEDQREKQTEAQLAMLGKHRECLLERIHAEERQISCLDYLVYQINKKK